MIDSLKKNFLISSNSFYDEDKLIEEALTTPYEKVINILNTVVKHLESYESGCDLAKSVKWVLQTIRSQKLYFYEGIPEKGTGMPCNSIEVKSFFEYLNLYSEAKPNFRRKVSRTEAPNMFKVTNLQNLNCCDDHEKTRKKLESFEGGMPKIQELEERSNYNDFLIDDVKPEKTQSSDTISLPDDDIPMDRPHFNPYENKFSSRDSFIFSGLCEMSFNIFDFAATVGYENAFILGGKEIINNTDINVLISEENLDGFIRAVHSGYIQDTPYHNSLHALDVLQTIYVYTFVTNICDLTHFNDLDILSILLSAMVHDLGHPGLNNNFHSCSLSDIAIQYNDKSVLENYHARSAFKTFKNEKFNILKKLKNVEFRHVRNE